MRNLPRLRSLALSQDPCIPSLIGSYDSKNVAAQNLELAQRVATDISDPAQQGHLARCHRFAPPQNWRRAANCSRRIEVPSCEATTSVINPELLPQSTHPLG
jgi:hypothetical protein